MRLEEGGEGRAGERREVPAERVSRAHPEEKAARGRWRPKVRADHAPSSFAWGCPPCLY